MVEKKVVGFLDHNEVKVFNDKLMYSRNNFSAAETNLIVRGIAGGEPSHFKIPKESGDYKYFSLSDTLLLVINYKLSNIHFRVYSLEDPVVYEGGIAMRVIALIETGLIPDPYEGNMFFISYKMNEGKIREVYKWENGKLNCCEHELIPRLNHRRIGNSVYKFGLKPSDYPKNGDHWAIFPHPSYGCEEISLIPKSTPSIEVNEGQRASMHDDAIIFSSIFSEEDPNIYYFIFRNSFYKVTVGGPQEEIATIIPVTPRARSINYYATNHGLRVKYDPNFIRSEEEPTSTILLGLLTTITIFPPQFAEKLQAVQKVIEGNYGYPHLISQIDGNFLLSAAMNPQNEPIFTNHDVDVNELKADLWTAFE